MTTDLAHKILETSINSDIDNIQDVFELKCFNIKKEVLMQSTFLESYLNNKARLFNQLEEAKCCLLNESFKPINLSNDAFLFPSTLFLIDFFTLYEAKITQAKLIFSNAIVYKDIIASLSQINSIQKGYLHYLNIHSESYDFSEAEEIPLKQQVDSGEIIQQLKSNENSLFLKELLRIERLLKIGKR